MVFDQNFEKFNGEISIQSYSSMKHMKLAYLCEGQGQDSEEGKHLSHRRVIYGERDKAANETANDRGDNHTGP